MTYANKDSYTGDWISGKKHGLGKYKYHNGDIYDGSWEKDQRHGKGTFTYKS